MDSNVNIGLKRTIHGTPTSKCQTMCNPWNLKLKPSDNVQSMELKLLDNMNPWNFSCNMTIYLSPGHIHHSHHLQSHLHFPFPEPHPQLCQMMTSMMMPSMTG